MFLDIDQHRNEIEELYKCIKEFEDAYSNTAINESNYNDVALMFSSISSKIELLHNKLLKGRCLNNCIMLTYALCDNSLDHAVLTVIGPNINFNVQMPNEFVEYIELGVHVDGPGFVNPHKDMPDEVYDYIMNKNKHGLPGILTNMASVYRLNPEVFDFIFSEARKDKELMDVLDSIKESVYGTKE